MLFGEQTIFLSLPLSLPLVHLSLAPFLTHPPGCASRLVDWVVGRSPIHAVLLLPALLYLLDQPLHRTPGGTGTGASGASGHGHGHGAGAGGAGGVCAFVRLTPLLRLRLRFCLPSLARHQACAVLVLKAIKPLLADSDDDGAAVLGQDSHQHSPPALGVRLMCRLWRCQPRTFSKLARTIGETGETQTFRSRESSKGEALRVAKCASILEVCRVSPGKGQELVKEVQLFLQDDSPRVVCLALSCLRSLCLVRTCETLSRHDKHPAA